MLGSKCLISCPANGEIEANSSERHAPVQSKSTLVGALLSGSGGRIRTDDLQVMSLTSTSRTSVRQVLEIGQPCELWFSTMNSSAVHGEIPPFIVENRPFMTKTLHSWRLRSPHET